LRLDSDPPDEHGRGEDRARFGGDHGAALAAEHSDALRAALPRVEVEYEPLPAAFDPPSALALGTAIHDAHPDNVALHYRAEQGDFAAASAGVAHWAEGVFRVEPVQHAYMEPYAALATYEPGKVTVHAPVHAPSVINQSYQPWAAEWEERLEFRTPAFGGSFGAKEAHPIHLICAEFAHRLKRDVGIGLSRREDFLTARPRVDMTLWVRIGASAEGRLLVKEAEILANNGAYSMHGPTVTVAAAM